MRELDRVQNDPTSTAATRDMVQVIRNMYKDSNKKEPKFDKINNLVDKAVLKVYKI